LHPRINSALYGISANLDQVENDQDAKTRCEDPPYLSSTPKLIPYANHRKVLSARAAWQIVKPHPTNDEGKQKQTQANGNGNNKVANKALDLIENLISVPVWRAGDKTSAKIGF